MERMILLIGVCAIVAIGLSAGGAGVLTGATLFNRPDCPGPVPGEVIVRPTGYVACDIVYAEHINLPNSKAYINQETGDYIAAETYQLQWQTEQSKIATWGLVIFFGAIIGFIVLVALRG